MKFFIFLISLNLYASDSDRAIETSQQAILAYPEIQKLQKNLSTQLEAAILLPKEYAAPLVTVTIAAIKGKIDTRSFKYNYIVLGGNFRPDTSYNLKSDEIVATFNINWSF